MNKARRKRLDSITGQIHHLQNKLQEILNEEEEAMYNVPENLQRSERYKAMEKAICDMDNAVSWLSDTVDTLDRIMEDQQWKIKKG